MTNPVALLRHIMHGDMTYDAIMFWCPGCEYVDPSDNTFVGGLHMLPVNTSAPVHASWTFDGNLEEPTLSPSILTSAEHKRMYNESGELVDVGKFVCHSFLNAGVFDFLGDCTHKYAGQKVPMKPLPDWVVRESDEHQD